MWRQVYARLRTLRRRGRQESELEEEIRFHLEEEIEERIAEGTSPEQARAAARRDFGNVTLIREQTRETWGWGPAERLLQDVRSAIWALRRNRGYTCAVVLTLALGIGLNAAMYGLLSQLFLQAPPTLRLRLQSHGPGTSRARGHGRGRRDSGDGRSTRGTRRLDLEGPRAHRRARPHPDGPRAGRLEGRHAVAPGRGRRCAGRASHCDRERVEPVDAAGGRPPARAGRAPRARRGQMGRRTPAGDRERPARRALRCGGAGRGGGRRTRPARHSAPALSVGRRPAGAHDDRVHRRRGAGGRPRGRSVPGGLRGTEPRDREARWPAGRSRAGSTGPYRADRRPGRPVSGAAGRRGHLLPFVRGGAPARHRLREGKPADGATGRHA